MANTKTTKVNKTSTTKVNKTKTTKVTKNVEQPAKPAKTWKVFNGVGYGLAIAAICLFWLPLLDLGLIIPAMVFSRLGKKDVEHPAKQKKAWGMSVAALILNILVFLVLVIVLPVLAAHKII